MLLYVFGNLNVYGRNNAVDSFVERTMIQVKMFQTVSFLWVIFPRAIIQLLQ